MKKLCLGAVFCLVSVTMACQVFALDKNGNFESVKERDRYISSTLKNMANQMNSQMPMMMDAETQASNVLALDKTINFTMRLINFSSNEVDASELHDIVRGNVNDIACKNKATRDLIDVGASYVYIYFGNDDRLITRVTLDDYSCGY